MRTCSDSAVKPIPASWKNTVQYAKIENKGFHVFWIKRHGFLISKPVCFLHFQNLQDIALVNYLTKL